MKEGLLIIKLRKKRRYEKYYEKLETDDLPRDISKMGE
jgi:hypothetical protein